MHELPSSVYLGSYEACLRFSSASVMLQSAAAVSCIRETEDERKREREGREMKGVIKRQRGGGII